MIFAILTLLSALSLAAVAGWFSIVGFMAIYAGAPMYALIMGVVTEGAKLVTASWLYRNWEYASWKLKAPLLYFTIALMAATSIGVFGFLSKAHIEQGAGTLNNSAKIETLTFQIDREKSIIADNEKVIAQLDATVNSFLGKERADRALAVRKSQAPQRKQLQDDISAAQRKIDELNAEKFKLESEVRALQLEVGPIRYIAELIYGVEENSTKNIESAVRIFTLLIVSTLDPLAVILLIAANSTLMRIKNEKEEKNKKPNRDADSEIGLNPIQETNESLDSEKNISFEEAPEVSKSDSDISTVIDQSREEVKTSLPLSQKVVEPLEDAALDKFFPTKEIISIPGAISPSVTRVARESLAQGNIPLTEEVRKNIPENKISEPWAKQSSVLRELLGTGYKNADVEKSSIVDKIEPVSKKKDFPKISSWLEVFRRNNEQ